MIEQEFKFIKQFDDDLEEIESAFFTHIVPFLRIGSNLSRLSLVGKFSIFVNAWNELFEELQASRGSK